ncbi:MAG: ThuA domain-containing protein [Candidatus Hydrogenedentes bacterium]|nr:ThuA domain-containing protein [Candidatus Hydrogenedentota bacterium]
MYRVLLSLMLAAVFSTGAFAAEKTRILFLSKSSGFEHSTIKEENGAVSHTGKTLQALAASMGAELTNTKDASLVNAENLKNYDVVIFYTTEDLTQTGADGNPAMSMTGVPELLAWIKEGGGFIGFHCASDTFHRERNQFAPESPYLDMVGGEFRSHGAQFEGTLKLVDAAHPAMANLKDGWKIKDEWYLFKDLMHGDLHVLALLEPGKERENQKDKYDLPPYPIAWCSSYGKGRVFYNGMGHREDVWDNESFQKSVADAITWARGDGEAGTSPNWSETVGTAINPKTGDDAAKGK